MHSYAKMFYLKSISNVMQGFPTNLDIIKVLATYGI